MAFSLVQPTDLSNWSLPMNSYEQKFRIACVSGDLDRALDLIEKNYVDTEIYGFIALEYACQNGRADIVRILLKNTQIDPSYNQNKLLQLACKNEHDYIISSLLKNPKVEKELYNMSKEQIKEIIKLFKLKHFDTKCLVKILYADMLDLIKKRVERPPRL